MGFLDSIPRIFGAIADSKAPAIAKVVGTKAVQVAKPTAWQNIKSMVIDAAVPAEQSFADRFPENGVGSMVDSLLEDARATTATKVGPIAKGFRKTLEGITPEQDIQINKALNGENVSLTSDLYARKAVRRELFNETWQHVDESGVPAERDVGFRNNYWPRTWDYGELDKYRKPGPTRESFIMNMMKEKGISRKGAEIILDSHLGNAARTKLYGPIDFKRLTDLPGYKLDTPGVSFDYVERAITRSELAKRFGTNNELVNKLSTQLPPEKQQLFVELANQIIGPKLVHGALEHTENAYLGWARSELVKRYMVYSAMSNMWQGPLGSFVTTDGMSTIKAFANIVRGADKPFLDDLGAIQAELSGSFGEFSKSSRAFINSGYRASEIFSRSMQALSSKYYLEKMLPKLYEGNQVVRNEFIKLGLDPDRVIKTGLTNYDKMKVANRLIHLTQFKPGEAMLPLAMHNPWVKTIFAMQSYNTQWLNFVRQHVINKELMQNHNPMPLVKLLGMGYAVGAANRLTWDTILGKKADKDNYSNFIANIGYSGSLGLLGDMMEGSIVGKTLSSPAINLFNELTAIPPNLLPAHGKDNHVKWQAVGNTIARRAVYPAMVEHLPRTVALPAAILARHFMEKAMRNEKPSKKHK